MRTHTVEPRHCLVLQRGTRLRNPAAGRSLQQIRGRVQPCFSCSGLSPGPDFDMTDPGIQSSRLEFASPVSGSQRARVCSDMVHTARACRQKTLEERRAAKRRKREAKEKKARAEAAKADGGAEAASAPDPTVAWAHGKAMRQSPARKKKEEEHASLAAPQQADGALDTKAAPMAEPPADDAPPKPRKRAVPDAEGDEARIETFKDWYQQKYGIGGLCEQTPLMQARPHVCSRQIRHAVVSNLLLSRNAESRVSCSARLTRALGMLGFDDK